MKLKGIVCYKLLWKLGPQSKRTESYGELFAVLARNLACMLNSLQDWTCANYDCQHKNIRHRKKENSSYILSYELPKLSTYQQNKSKPSWRTLKIDRWPWISVPELAWNTLIHAGPCIPVLVQLVPIYSGGKGSLEQNDTTSNHKTYLWIYYVTPLILQMSANLYICLLPVISSHFLTKEIPVHRLATMCLTKQFCSFCKDMRLHSHKSQCCCNCSYSGLFFLWKCPSNRVFK
jgi:hypothetical protein